MLNAIGLQNVGIDAFIRDKVPYLQTLETPVIVNFFGNQLHEYIEVAEKLSDIEAVDAVELNISCPNVKQGGIVFGTEPCAAAEVVSGVRKVLNKPLIVKLTPNVTDITVMARAVEEAGADVISCVNTLTGMAVDIEKTPSASGQWHRWTVGTGHQAGGVAHGLSGGAGRHGTGDRYRRYHDRQGCLGISACRCDGRSGGNRQSGQPRCYGGDR